MRVSIQNKPNEFWAGDDYHGMSLSSLTDVLHARNYRLIACGVSGVNAFFVRDSDAPTFPTFTVEQIFQPARFYLRKMASGHPPSLKFLKDMLSKRA